MICLRNKQQYNLMVYSRQRKLDLLLRGNKSYRHIGISSKRNLYMYLMTPTARQLQLPTAYLTEAHRTIEAETARQNNTYTHLPTSMQHVQYPHFGEAARRPDAK